MKRIDTITNKPDQKFSVSIDEGGSVEIRLYYKPTQNMWFYDFTYNNYTCKGSTVALSPNSIRHLQNILPFGIAFLAENTTIEPYDINDFSSKRVEMYILNSDEVAQIEDLIYNVS